MRRSAIFFTIFLFFIAVFVYVLTYQNPFDKDKLLALASLRGFKTDNQILANINNIIETGLIWDVLDFRKATAFIISYFSIFLTLATSLHLFFDKLFFKKFFEEPNLFIALRRAFLFSSCLTFPIFLRLFNGVNFINVITFILLSICIEFLFMSLFDHKEKHKEQSVQNKAHKL